MPDSLRIVFRVEIATLLKEGQLDLSRMERVSMLCTNLMNCGHKVVLVSSGAIFLGSQRLGMDGIPITLTGKQAAAAVGQAELITQYQNCFDGFNQTVAQVLLTQDVLENRVWRLNAENTFRRLMDKGIIPIVNENDSVSTEDIELGDNYPLALKVARIVHAHMIILRHISEGTYLVYTYGGEVVQAGENEIFETAKRLKRETGFMQRPKQDFPAGVPQDYIY